MGTQKQVRDAHNHHHHHHHRQRLNSRSSQEGGTEDIPLFIIVLLVVGGVCSAAFGAGGSLQRRAPLHGAGEGRRRSVVLDVVHQSQLVSLRSRGPLRSLGAADGLRAVAGHGSGHRRLVPLDPGVIITHDVLVVESRQQRHLAFDPPELFAGRVHLDPLDRVITAVQRILDLNERTKL